MDSPTLQSHHIRKVTISWGKLCPPLLELKNLGGLEAVHTSGLALAFGSEHINPWLPELVFVWLQEPSRESEQE